MKYCPNCKRDFEDNVTFCRWCEVDTVDSLDQKADEQTAAQGIDGEKACIWTTYDVLAIPSIEEALKAAGIPVEVRQSEIKLEDEDDETEEKPEETPEEPETEPVEAPEEPKTGFFARLFNRKPQNDGPERRVVGERPNLLFHKDPNERVSPVFEDELFDIIVPAESAEDAKAVLDKVFGIVGAEGYGIDNGDADEEDETADV